MESEMSVGIRTTLLSRIPLLARLNFDAMENLAETCVWTRFDPEDVVIFHKEKTDDVFLLATGSVRAKVFTEAGRDVMFEDLHGPGHFGELAALDRMPRSCHVIALTECSIARISSDQFLNLIESFPSVSVAALRRMAQIQRALLERVYSFSAFDVGQRVNAELLRLSIQTTLDGKRADLQPAPTHAEIAARVSTHREAVTRHLKDLDQARLITRNGRSITVHDIEKLAATLEEAEMNVRIFGD